MWDKLKHRVWEWRGVLITALSVTVLLVALRLLGWLQPLELAAVIIFFYCVFEKLVMLEF